MKYNPKGNCQKEGHQYQYVDEQGAYPSYPSTIPSSIPASLREIYGGLFVKHVFCSKCGDYRAVRLKADRELEKFIKLNQLTKE